MIMTIYDIIIVLSAWGDEFKRGVVEIHKYSSIWGGGGGGATDLNALDSQHAKVAQKHPSSVECLHDAVKERRRGREREREREGGRERGWGRNYDMKHIPLKHSLHKIFKDDNCCEYCGPEYSCEIFSHRFRNLAKL